MWLYIREALFYFTGNDDKHAYCVLQIAEFNYYKSLITSGLDLAFNLDGEEINIRINNLVFKNLLFKLYSLFLLSGRMRERSHNCMYFFLGLLRK